MELINIAAFIGGIFAIVFLRRQFFFACMGNAGGMALVFGAGIIMAIAGTVYILLGHVINIPYREVSTTITLSISNITGLTILGTIVTAIALYRHAFK